MADFKTAVAITLDKDHEGGYQDDPNDHANWSSGKIGEGELVGTKYGITALDMPGVVIKDITEDQAAEYYKEHYWKTLYSQIDDQEVANKLFDMGVLFGVGEAVKLLQLTLQPAFGTTPDEVFGPETLSHVNQAEPTSLLRGYKTALVAYTLRIAVNNPAERGDVAGWGRRINS